MSFMIEKNTEIVRDMVVRHVDGLTYKVEDVRTSTAGYEKTHELGAKVVNYVQLEQGDFPPGHPWSKPENEFREYFSVVSFPETSSSI